MINIDDLALREVKELKALLGGDNAKSADINPFSKMLGKNVFIRSVTHHYTGKVAELIGSTGAVLTDAAWIADDGRFHNALKKSDFGEVEPYVNPVVVNWGAVLDYTEIEKLPREQK